MKKFFYIICVVILFAACSRNLFQADNGELSARSISFVSLLNELVDLSLLSEEPEYQYKLYQASSYDRRSTNPYDKTETNWFGNADAGQYIRVEKINGTNEYVMMDADGPGAIVRMWSANPDGILRIYLDGTNVPEIKMPMKEIMNGKSELFPNPICHEASRGYNCYMPIPFSKHCKVTTTSKSIYYHVDYRQYVKGTKVKTYTKEAAKENYDLITNIAEKLEHPEKIPYFINIDHIVNFSADLDKGSVYKYKSESKKSGKIYSFICKVAASNIEEVLCNTLIEIFFDDDNEAAVNMPLGDFFGTAPGLNKYRSLPLGVLDDGTMYCHWVMPFKDHFQIRITNFSDEKIYLNGNIIFSREKWDDKNLYFRTKFTADSSLPTRPISERTLLKFFGKGRIVGCMMQINNHSHKWWGEGDEKIFVDGEYFPSIFGTGTEDYFGYAWGDTKLFTHAYHNQIRVDNPDWYGNTCNSRFHIIDNIPFYNSIQFNMELWTHVSTTVDVATTVYFYGK